MKTILAVTFLIMTSLALLAECVGIFIIIVCSAFFLGCVLDLINVYKKEEGIR
jgi:hypothetical protein